jgi:uncharacterized membrane protein YjgN (DUF898 family)
MTAIPVNEAVPASEPAPSRGPARFLGKEITYWRLMIRGSLLLLVTLGIYRFWLATDQRRFLWANTDLGGQSFEYNGTAMELLLGFLMALAILVPLYALFFLLALAIGQLASLLGLALLFLFGQFAVYRARRYRLTRTVFRGVRFHQTGSGWRYALYAVGWWLVIVLTLGLAYPWSQAVLERYKMRHTFYGDLRGTFEGSGWVLFARGFGLWAIVIGPLVFGLLFMVTKIDWDSINTAAAQGGDVMGRIEGGNPELGIAAAIMIGATTWSFVAAALLYPAFQALTLRWWASGLRFGELAMNSRLRTGQVYRLYLRFLGYAVLLTLAGIVIGALAVAMGYALPENPREVVLVLFPFVLYVLIALGFSIIYQVTVKLGLWRTAIETVDLSGLVALERVKAEGAPGSSFGEGLADALNVGGL